MIPLEKIRERLKYMNIKAVSEACGLHHNTVYSLMDEKSEPKHKTVKALSEFLEGLEGRE